MSERRAELSLARNNVDKVVPSIRDDRSTINPLATAKLDSGQDRFGNQGNNQGKKAIPTTSPVRVRHDQYASTESQLGIGIRIVT